MPAGRRRLRDQRHFETRTRQMTDEVMDAPLEAAGPVQRKDRSRDYRHADGTRHA